MSAELEQLLQQMANPSEIAWNEETYDLGLARSAPKTDRAAALEHLHRGP